MGRLARVEELNWDQSVYSTTYEYNARDQIASINQQGLVRAFEYDGHGRLSRRTTPEQGATSYDYNPDDTARQVTDARGAATAFVYNGRHLVTNINYTVPAGVAQTPNVVMGYDSAGNRTSMADGRGTVAYSYDTQSSLAWEERAFAGVGAYRLSYEYNLAGQLARVANPWGARVAYERDANGRTTAVRGTDQSGRESYAGAGTYAAGLQYRAFGGLKAMSYGGQSLSVLYDARLRATRWDVAGVLGWEYHYDNAADPNLWLSDSSHRVLYARNLYDPSRDRSFDYDHLGRLIYSHSGVGARMHAYNRPSDGGQQGPYSHHYGYDV